MNDRFDRINNIREQEPIQIGEMPSSQDNEVKARSYNPFPKIVAIILIAALILTAIGFIIKYDKKQKWAVYFLFIFYLLLIIHNFIMLASICII